MLTIFSSGGPLQAVFLLAIPAKFPDQALGAKPAVPAGIRTRLASIEALLAVPDLHLVAFYESISFRMKAAFHEENSGAVTWTAKVPEHDTGGKEL